MFPCLALHTVGRFAHVLGGNISCERAGVTDGRGRGEPGCEVGAVGVGVCSGECGEVGGGAQLGVGDGDGVGAQEGGKAEPPDGDDADHEWGD